MFQENTSRLTRHHFLNQDSGGGEGSELSWRVQVKKNVKLWSDPLEIDQKCFKVGSRYLLFVITLPSYLLAAIQSLKRKKRYEKQLTQIDGQISTLEFQKEALENASSNTEVLRCMGAAQHALKISDVHDLSDE